MPAAPNHWLFKTEPESYSVHDLAAEPEQTTCWDGVRNFQARNFMRDSVRRGDRVLIYHSNADPPHVAGAAEVVREAYPDPSSWDSTSQYFDPRSSPENPRWCMVDIQLREVFAAPLPLEMLRGEPELAGMELLRRGSRLSVQPVSPAEFAAVLRLAQRCGASPRGATPRGATARGARSKRRSAT